MTVGPGLFRSDGPVADIASNGNLDRPLCSEVSFSREERSGGPRGVRRREVDSSFTVWTRWRPSIHLMTRRRLRWKSLAWVLSGPNRWSHDRHASIVGGFPERLIWNAQRPPRRAAETLHRTRGRGGATHPQHSERAQGDNSAAGRVGRHRCILRASCATEALRPLAALLAAQPQGGEGLDRPPHPLERALANASAGVMASGKRLGAQSVIPGPASGERCGGAWRRTSGRRGCSSTARAQTWICSPSANDGRVHVAGVRTESVLHDVAEAHQGVF